MADKDSDYLAIVASLMHLSKGNKGNSTSNIGSIDVDGRVWQPNEAAMVMLPHQMHRQQLQYHQPPPTIWETTTTVGFPKQNPSTSQEGACMKVPDMGIQCFLQTASAPREQQQHAIYEVCVPGGQQVCEGFWNPPHVAPALSAYVSHGAWSIPRPSERPLQQEAPLPFLRPGLQQIENLTQPMPPLLPSEKQQRCHPRRKPRQEQQRQAHQQRPPSTSASAASSVVSASGTMSSREHEGSPSALQVRPMPSTRITAAVVRPGIYGQKLGDLDGLRTEEMGKYEHGKSGKQKRRKRHDISHLSEEEKVQRRRGQSREYNRMVREGLHRQEMEMEREVAEMRDFKAMIENAPYIMFVLKASAQGIIKYVNKTVERLLGDAPEKAIGSSLLDMVHQLDRPVLGELLNATVLEATGQKRTVHCHLRCPAEAAVTSVQYKCFEMRVSYGTQGLVCTATEVPRSKAEGC